MFSGTTVDYPVNCFSFSPDGRTLASAADDQTIRLWEVAAGMEKAVVNLGYPVIQVSFSPDGQTLASVSNDNTIRL
jgi:WD40 repeat protein